MKSEAQTRKILFITDDLGGGTGNHVLSMLKTWDKSRWQIKIVCHNPVSARVASDVSIDLGPSYRSFDRYPIHQIRRLFQLKKNILNYKPDITHCYFFWPIIYGRILKALGKIGILIENREDQGFNWGRHEYILLRLTRSLPDRVICVSEAVRQVVLEKEGLDPRRTVVIHNGVQMPGGCLVNKPEVLRELGMNEGNLVVGMVANLNRSVKGVSYFLDAIPLIIQAVPEARFVIFGRGHEEQTLRNKARALAIEPYVIFAGYRENIERYYPIMDISILTSLSEGLSITLLESMSYGLPVVVTRVGGNPEVVVDGQTGYLVPPKDVSAFADRVVKLLRDPNLRAYMGQNGLQRVQERFQLRQTASRYLDLYKEVLGVITRI